MEEVNEFWMVRVEHPRVTARLPPTSLEGLKLAVFHMSGVIPATCGRITLKDLLECGPSRPDEQRVLNRLDFGLVLVT